MRTGFFFPQNAKLERKQNYQFFNYLHEQSVWLSRLYSVIAYILPSTRTNLAIWQQIINEITPPNRQFTEKKIACTKIDALIKFIAFKHVNPNLNEQKTHEKRLKQTICERRMIYSNHKYTSIILHTGTNVFKFYNFILNRR